MVLTSQVLATLVVTVLLSSSTDAKKKKKRKDVECSPFPHAELPHGRIVAIGPQKYTFICNPGHLLTSPKTVRCFKGNWTSVKKPNCKRAGSLCDDPTAIPGGKIYGDERRVNSVILYVCDPGFQMVGESKRTCLRNTHWSGVTPTCVDQSLKSVSQRIRDKFVVEVGAHSSDSRVAGRALDSDSVKNGLELIIMIDRSSSIDPVDLKLGIRFINFLLKTFGVKNVENKSGTRAAVMTFGNSVEILFNLDDERITSPSAAKEILDAIKPGGGGTAMDEAFIAAFTSLSPLREEAKKAIFMLTDGVPNNGTEVDTIHFAVNLREKGFEIFTVGVGPDVNRQLLAKLASEPTANHVFILDKYADFGNITHIIQEPPKKASPISQFQCGYIERREHFLQRWPWLAALYIGFPNKSNSTDLSFCSGTMICKQWIITAASCLFRINQVNETVREVVRATKELFVVMGERNLVEDDNSQHSFYAFEVHIHPEFDPLNDLMNNLALVKLNAEASMRRYRPACYPPTDTPVPLHLTLNINASIAGWGLPPSKSNDREINGGTVRLHVANSTASLEEEERYCPGRSAGEAKSRVFCATSGMHSCVGNLGSPIIAVYPATNLHYLLGVESSRSNCHKGVNQYSELTQFLPWMNEITNHCHKEHVK